MKRRIYIEGLNVPMALFPKTGRLDDDIATTTKKRKISERCLHFTLLASLR